MLLSRSWFKNIALLEGRKVHCNSERNYSTTRCGGILLWPSLWQTAETSPLTTSNISCLEDRIIGWLHHIFLPQQNCKFLLPFPQLCNCFLMFISHFRDTPMEPSLHKIRFYCYCLFSVTSVVLDPCTNRIRLSLPTLYRHHFRPSLNLRFKENIPSLYNLSLQLQSLILVIIHVHRPDVFILYS